MVKMRAVECVKSFLFSGWSACYTNVCLLPFSVCIAWFSVQLYLCSIGLLNFGLVNIYIASRLVGHCNHSFATATCSYFIFDMPLSPLLHLAIVCPVVSEVQGHFPTIRIFAGLGTIFNFPTVQVVFYDF